MTLRDVILAMERLAASSPAVNTVVGNDVFEINALPSVKYGVFAWTQGEHRADVSAGLIRYSFTLFYVDLLQNDGANRLQIQTAGIQMLGNLLLQLDAEDIVTDGEVTFRSFNQRFTDECAGVYTNVTLLVPMDTTCAENYD
jgi:hypothetical protein